MKDTGRLLESGNGKNIMKMLLFSGCVGTLVFCVVSTSSHPFVRVLLSALALLAIVHELLRRAPLGYQDERGFHYGPPRGGRPRGRKPRKNLVFGSLLPRARLPLQARARA